MAAVARKANSGAMGGKRILRWGAVSLGLAPSAIQVPAGAEPGAMAEISIDGSVSAPGVKVGHDLLYPLVMQNHGPDGAWDVILTVALDPDVTFGSVEAAPGISIDLMQANNAALLSAEVGAASSPCDMWGTSGPDRSHGTNRSEVVCGNGGDDVLVGGGGRDRMRGGPGSDRCRRRGGDSVRSCS